MNEKIRVRVFAASFAKWLGGGLHEDQFVQDHDEEFYKVVAGLHIGKYIPKEGCIMIENSSDFIPDYRWEILSRRHVAVECCNQNEVDSVELIRRKLNHLGQSYLESNYCIISLGGSGIWSSVSDAELSGYIVIPASEFIKQNNIQSADISPISVDIIEPSNNWINSSILPKHGIEVNVIGQFDEIFTARYDKIKSEWYIYSAKGRESVFHITHWCALPQK